MKYSKEDIRKKYDELKYQNDGKPLLYKVFLKVSGVSENNLRRAFGPKPYTKLQEFAGDVPNIFDMTKKTDVELMTSYGDLALETLKKEDRLPVGADWEYKGFTPVLVNLRKNYDIKWTEFPRKFYKYCDGNSSFRTKYFRVLKEIEDKDNIDRITEKKITKSGLFNKVCKEIQNWSPPQRRSVEEAYKSDLSAFLKTCKNLQQKDTNVREEKGDSKCDIGIGSEIAIEIKKSPNLSAYDRCFGQIARHLNGYKYVIVVVFDVLKEEQFQDFKQLVDKYYKDSVSVIKNG